MPVYECDGCGACCQGLLLIEVYELDLLREPRLQTVDPRHAGRSRADSLDELSDPDRCLIIAGRCPFFWLRTSDVRSTRRGRTPASAWLPLDRPAPDASVILSVTKSGTGSDCASSEGVKHLPDTA